MSTAQPNNPLHGKSLEYIVNELVATVGWAEMGHEVPIKCFTDHPTVSSSLKFLRKTAWARTRVEQLYLNRCG